MAINRTGRRKITSPMTSKDLVELENLETCINSAMQYHNLNKIDIDYLVNYRLGEQPILAKTKVIRDDINNILVINHAQMITRNIIGYFLGTPIQYIQNGDTKKKDAIDELNRYVQYEDKASVDKEIGEYQSICGTAYRIIYTDGALADEVPFENKALDPSNTFVVYENNIAEKPLVGVTYHDLYDMNGDVESVMLYCYTEFGIYTIKTNNSAGEINGDSAVQFAAYNVGGVPIVEYPNNIWRVGDWELCLSLMDAINKLQSDRLDDIDQIVQSLLVFVNADIDEATYSEMRAAGAVMLNNKTGLPTDVKNVSNPLDHSGMSIYAGELESMLYAIIGIPDRKSRSGGGGDTGQAVELRDGWADLEILARNKELTFKKAEKMSLRIILKIMSNKLNTNLSLMDIDIKFTRNKNNNMLVKTQSYSNL